MQMQTKFEVKLPNQYRETIERTSREVVHEISDLLTVISLNVDLAKNEIRQAGHGIPTEAKMRVYTIMGKVEKITELAKQHLLS